MTGPCTLCNLCTLGTLRAHYRNSAAVTESLAPRWSYVCINADVAYVCQVASIFSSSAAVSAAVSPALVVVSLVPAPLHIRLVINIIIIIIARRKTVSSETVSSKHGPPRHDVAFLKIWHGSMFDFDFRLSFHDAVLRRSFLRQRPNILVVLYVLIVIYIVIYIVINIVIYTSIVRCV
jgi:hypothetical protein